MTSRNTVLHFLNHRNRWIYLWTGLFMMAIAVTTISVHNLFQQRLHAVDAGTLIVFYAAITTIALTGALAVWVTSRARKEVMIERSNEGAGRESRGPRLTITHAMVNTNGTVVASTKKPLNLNGLSSEVVTIYAEDKSIRYISPAVENVFGYKQLEMIGQSDIEHVHPDHRASFSHIFTRLRENPSEQIKVEYAYKTKAGDYIWLESAGSNGLSDAGINGYLVRTSDITERKRIEIEVHQQNRKITESIQYAKRIQSAILPNVRLIHRALPDSFILYKPRDVVSGDFPWFAQVKSDIYMAAVDCTGHGVPGALLSLVAYFLLNDIVRSRKVTDPSKILDLLDEGVSTTLKSEDDGGTKDGMDISLCKIDIARREVVYAGAHRSLYVMRSGALEEVKGNKFAIGGGIFKNQTNFTSTKLALRPGDSIYFCSDGYADQFGGPKGRKFGASNFREILTRVHAMSMQQALGVFEREWEKWKGTQKQTDDVLLIGVKF